MEQNALKNQMWNSAGCAGLALGSVSAAYLFATQMIAGSLEPATASQMVVSTLLWIAKFGGCIWLMNFFMKKYAADNKITDNKPVFKIQFMVSSTKLDSNDKAFKGLTPVDYYYDKGLYKYTYNATTDYNKILQVKKKVNEKFKDAFIVAFINGERIDTQKAIALYKESNP